MSDAVSLRGLDENTALRTILEGTATETGARFFLALVESLSKALRTDGAWVTEYAPDRNKLRALAFWLDGRWIEGYEFELAGSPCEQAIRSKQLVHFPDRLLDLYPRDRDAIEVGAVAYLGMPLLDLNDEVLGHMAVIDRRPMPDEPQMMALFRIFASRAAAELQRLKLDAVVRDDELKLSRLVDGAMDAIIELDGRLQVTRWNPAAEGTFGCGTADVLGQEFRRFLSEGSAADLERLVGELSRSHSARGSQWIAGGLRARRASGEEFAAEATLSKYESQREDFYTLILRNVDERLKAEKTIRALTSEAAYLKEEICAIHNFDEILGQSEPLLGALRDVERVAPTDASVLILGETGTGKELFARAIHNASSRRGKPLIKVNCAAIPASLIESEFFGHEKGAFTGATGHREGRFALADGGTIFLDEIADLPVELQSKLLRVLQEGEFEPVGSSKTIRVDVRVLAATNQDLELAARQGEFREDLYYRLNVFPIKVPPLRERGDDIALLAGAFIERYARRSGRSIQPLTTECIRRLNQYSWPGNVRELENVIERASITSLDGCLNLVRALPDSLDGTATQDRGNADHSEEPIRTAQQLQQLERDNIVRALNAAGWKVAGERGAARMLGMNSSTLNSRMRALGIKRP